MYWCLKLKIKNRSGQKQQKEIQSFALKDMFLSHVLQFSVLYKWFQFNLSKIDWELEKQFNYKNVLPW